MIESHIGHIQFNVQPANLAFYKDLMSALGWVTIHEAEGILGVGNGLSTSLWFIGYPKEGVSNDYDGPGMNHLGFGVGSQADVDTAAAYLTERGVALLFETPRHRPEFSMGEDQTYYQVMFETPDRILLEIVYMGPK